MFFGFEYWISHRPLLLWLERVPSPWRARCRSEEKQTSSMNILVVDHLQNISQNVFYNIHENKRKQLFQQQMFLTTCNISATIFLSGEAPPCECSQWKKQANLKPSLIGSKKLCSTLSIFDNEPCKRTLESENEPVIWSPDKWKPDLCRRTSCGNLPGEKKRDPTVLEDCLCLHVERL